MDKSKNHFVPIDDLNNFLSNIREVEENCQDNSYTTNKIANRYTLSGKNLDIIKTFI